MSMLRVLIRQPEGTGWDEASRYHADEVYKNTRFSPPRDMLGRQMAEDDAMNFRREYEREVRVTCR